MAKEKLNMIFELLPRGAKKAIAIGGILLFAWIAAWATVKNHDRKVVSRVIENSQREARNDVTLSKQAHSASLAGTGGVRSSYRRD